MDRRRRMDSMRRLRHNLRIVLRIETWGMAYAVPLFECTKDAQIGGKIMKVRMTKKKVMETNMTVLRVDCCALDNLLRMREPYAYTCGGDGWHADIYSVGTTAISTGYYPFGKKVPYELCKKYDDEALKYFRQFDSVDPDISRMYMDDLLYAFIEEAKSL